MSQLVRLHASHALHFVHSNETLFDASALMKKFGIHHLPVVDESHNIVGMLSDRDVQRAMVLGDRYPSAKVQNFMSYPVDTIREDASIASAAQAMLDGGMSSLIVTDGENTVGIITSHDLLQYIVEREESSFQYLKDYIKAEIASTPLGGVAHTLANSGL